MHQITSHFMIY